MIVMNNKLWENLPEFSMELLEWTLKEMSEGKNYNPEAMAAILQDIYSRLWLLKDARILEEVTDEVATKELGKTLNEMETKALDEDQILSLQQDLENSGEKSYYYDFFIDPEERVSHLLKQKIPETQIWDLQCKAMKWYAASFMDGKLLGDIKPSETNEWWFVYTAVNGIDVTFTWWTDRHKSYTNLILKRDGTMDTDILNFYGRSDSELEVWLSIINLVPYLLNDNEWADDYKNSIPANPEKAFMLKKDKIVFDAEDPSVFVSYDVDFPETKAENIRHRGEKVIEYLNQRYFYTYKKN